MSLDRAFRHAPRLLAILAVAVALGRWGARETAADPAKQDARSAPVSRYAPARFVVSQAKDYARRIEKSLAQYDEVQAGRLGKESQALAALLLAAGLHDEETPWRGKSGALVAAALAVGDAAEQEAAARAAGETLRRGLEMPAADGEKSLDWKQKFHVGRLMKQAEIVNTLLRRNLPKIGSETDREKSAALAAAQAVFAQVSLFLPPATATPAQVEVWERTSLAWRDAAAAIGASALAGDADAADRAMKLMVKSCADCHVDFRR